MATDLTLTRRWVGEERGKQLEGPLLGKGKHGVGKGYRGRKGKGTA